MAARWSSHDRPAGHGGLAAVTFTAPWRKLVLVLHVTSSLGFLGSVAAFLALAWTGARAADSSLLASVYPAMQVMTWAVIVPFAVATLVVGLVQSLGTAWGLFRYYWVIVKLVLTAVALAVLLLQTQSIDLLAQAARSGELSLYSAAKVSMVVHGAGGLVVLLVATVLSVYKPRGVTGHGARAIAEHR